ncbi:MAG TPA: dihydrolipoamide acetyltransferase family protein [Armatimonadota bacterium]|nr:dihydrolipoamide acetyltransferase family protein [Armatimonadota bacterium]
MAKVFYLPQMGQTMTEATILKWFKNEGDAVEGWEDLVEMMTDKINMGVEATISGTLLKILAPEGAVVAVGGPVAVIGEPGEDISGLLAELGSGPASAGEAGPTPTVPGEVPEIPLAASSNGDSGHEMSPIELPEAPLDLPGMPPSAIPGELPNVSPRAREAAEAAGLEWKSLQIPGTGFEGMIVERDVLAFLESAERPPDVLATPLASKIAADLGVSLEGLAGSGPRGRVRAEDVRQAASGKNVPPIEAREIPLQGMRKVIASRLSGSYQQAVHVPLRVDVDMTAAAALRSQLKPVLEGTGARLTYTDLLCAAAVQALVAYPALNATLEGDVIRIHPSVNLGVAVALEEGLTVPVIADAHALRLPELSLAISEAAVKARAGQLPAAAYAGGTFTITNLGQFGVDSFDPIINPPQVAILGCGRIQDRVVAVDGAPAVRPMMTVTVTFDHRALDGAPGSRFLAKVKELLENPARLLL